MNFWLRLLPKGLAAKLRSRDQVMLVADNAFWLTADRGMRMVLGLLVGVWVARYLGPADFGLFNYALALVALCGALGVLGLDDIVVRELVKGGPAGEILGTAFWIKLLGGLMGWALALAAVRLARPDSRDAFIFVAIFGSVCASSSVDVAAFWFQSKVRSRFTVMARGGAYLLSTAAKIAFIMAGAGLMSFVILSVAESVLADLALAVLYRRQAGAPWPWTFSLKQAAYLMKEGAPLFLAYLSYLLYTRTDQFMLGNMAGDRSVGVFSAATRIFEIPMAVLAAFGSSVYPKLIEWHAADREKFELRYRQLNDFFTWAGIAVVALLFLLAPWLVRRLYGSAYRDSAPVLAFQLIGLLFVFNAALRSSWVAIHGQQRVFFWCTLMAGILNVGANWVLIPRYGALGSAWATAGAQAFSLLFSNIFFKGLRPVMKVQLRSFYHPGGMLAALRSLRA